MYTKTAVLALLVSEVTGAWLYDRCDASAGPAAWGLAQAGCYGAQQSPIDLCGAVPIPPQPVPVRTKKPKGGNAAAAVANYTVTGLNYNKQHVITLKNTGHTMETSEGPAVPILRVPGLHFLVGRSDVGSIVQPDWTFAQMHLHFGREGNPNEGSEHVVEGRRFPGEAHFVHYNPARGANLTAALATGKKDAVLVVGVLLDLGDAALEPALLKQIAAAAPALQPPPLNVPMNLTAQGMLSDIVNLADSYYTYAGSLTTPGCAEQVTWMVLRTPRVISAASLELLKLVKENVNETISVKGNFRPVQPLGTRVLYSSVNVSSTCSAIPVPDPCFTCGVPAPAVVLFNAQAAGSEQAAQEEGAYAATPAWVWVGVGVAVPTVLIAAVFSAFQFTAWRRGGASEKAAAAYNQF